MIAIFWKVFRLNPGKLLTFLARSLGAICVYDRQKQPIYVSPKFLKLMRSGAEQIGSFDDFVRLPQLVPIESHWDVALQGKTVSFLSKTRDGDKDVECSLQLDPALNWMFLTAKTCQRSIRKLAEEYERLVLTLFRHPGVAAALVSLDGVVVKSNARLHEFLGTNEGEIIQIDQFTHAEDQLVDADLRQKLMNGSVESYTIDKRLIDKNNEAVWVCLSVSLVDVPIRLDEYQQYFVVLFEDVTENQKIYDALVRTEGKWKTFVLNSLNLFIQTSSTGQIIYASPAVERILGYEAEEMLDLYISEFIHPNDLNDFELALRLWSSDSKFNKMGMECRWKAKSGLWVCLHIQGQKFPLSLEINGLIIDGYDITDRKFLEAELKASEEKFQSLVRNFPGAVFQCDSAYVMKFVSDGVQKMMGYSASDLINNQVQSYLSIVHPGDVEFVKRSMMQSLLDRRPCSIEYRILHATRGVRWISEYRQGRFDSKGKLLQFEGVLFDVSGTKPEVGHLQASRRRMS